MAKTKGMSGVAIAMIATGVLAVYSAIKGSSPLEELRSILGGGRPEPLGTASRGSPVVASGAPGKSTETFSGPGSAKARTVGAQRHVAAAARHIAATWNVTADATLVSSGHITNSDHYRGLAIDVMLPRGAAGTKIGNEVAAAYRSHPQIKYIIWQHEIWSVTKGSSRYSKNDHMGHVHLSFNPEIRGRVGR